MSRRAQIVMSGAESDAFLAAGRTVTCATLGRTGWPHLMPLWHVLRDTRPTSPAGTGRQVWAWTEAAKRVALQFLKRRRRTWDQGKLGGAY